MRRRQDERGNPLPVKLRRFVPGDWPGATEYRQAEAWAEAVDKWRDAHPNVDASNWAEIGDVRWDPAVDPP